MNYPLIALIILLALAFVVLLAWKNYKDRKSLEKEMNRTEIKPEKHDEKKSNA
jgi:hypothetical protein